MRMEDLKGRITVVRVRLENERPRAEIQPEKIGRERPVRAVQHGNTLRSADYRRVGRCWRLVSGSTRPKLWHLVENGPVQVLSTVPARRQIEPELRNRIWR